MITLKGDDYEAQKMIAQTDTENPSFSTAYIKEWYVHLGHHFMKSFKILVYSSLHVRCVNENWVHILARSKQNS